MRQPIIAGNWKMNKTTSEAINFVSELKNKVIALSNTNIIIAPPYTALYPLKELSKNTSINLSSQDISIKESGAYTGEISFPMLKDCGCSYSIIGHSERRQYHNETNASCQEKCYVAMNENITPIYCIGETLEQRENDQTLTVIEDQLLTGLKDLPLTIKPFIIAYEPVWAIGTGKVATPNQAQDIHQFIRHIISTHIDTNLANKIQIIYGGSVNPKNFQSLIEEPDIDGALVGGSCLKIDSFTELITIAHNYTL
jgi:triosephosphate isomerase (TIM)